jgi:hypothetical protein
MLFLLEPCPIKNSIVRFIPVMVFHNEIVLLAAGHNSMPPTQGSLSPATSSSATPTGPDGVPLHDETSQQSTLSQSSDRSDGRQTPKAGPNFIPGPAPGPPGYPTPGSPHSSAPSPGGSLSSSVGGHEGGYARDIASPNWQRTPASPISAPPQVKLAWLLSGSKEQWVTSLWEIISYFNHNLTVY